MQQPANYLSLARTFITYRRPLTFARRYFVGGGSYPIECELRTPLGRVAPTVYSHHDVFTVNEIFCRRDYEPPVDAKVVIDIGANIGLSALYFLTRSASARCYLFEPDPRNVDRLKRNLVGFESRYELRSAAVGDSEGVMRFGREPTGRYGGIGIETQDTIEVDCVEINSVIRHVLARESRVDMVKIDTEGMENRTVAAIERPLLGQIQTLVFETKAPFNPANHAFELHFANQTCRLTRR